MGHFSYLFPMPMWASWTFDDPPPPLILSTWLFDAPRLSLLIPMSYCNVTMYVLMQCTCNAPIMQIQCSCYTPAMPKQISLIFGIKMEKGEKVRGNEAEQ